MKKSGEMKKAKKILGDERRGKGRRKKEEKPPDDDVTHRNLDRGGGEEKINHQIGRCPDVLPLFSILPVLLSFTRNLPLSFLLFFFPRMSPSLLLLLLLVALLPLASPLLVPHGPGVEIPVNPKDQGVLVFEDVIRGPAGSPWLRVFFSQLALPPNTLAVLTSLEDGAQQHLDYRIASQWQLSSAYFNGDSVEIKVFAGARHPLRRTAPAKYHAAFVKGGDATPAVEDGVLRIGIESIQSGVVSDQPKSICFNPDTRVFTNDTRQGRCMLCLSFHFLFLPS